MDTTTTLVLSFLDTDSNEVNISIKNPKTGLQLAAVTTVMEEIIDNNGFVSNKDLPLDCVNTCYYRTVTKTALTNAGGGE